MTSLYETHLPVSDLARSSTFYRDILGLVPAFAQPHRGVAFFYFGARERGMLGLWAPGSPWGWKPGETHRCHFAIAVSLPELLANVDRLKSLGIELRGADDQPVDEPSVIGWMPSTQIYFHDPDGHLVEFINLLDEEPSPSFFGSLSAWREQKPLRSPSSSPVASAIASSLSVHTSRKKRGSRFEVPKRLIRNRGFVYMPGSRMGAVQVCASIGGMDALQGAPPGWVESPAALKMGSLLAMAQRFCCKEIVFHPAHALIFSTHAPRAYSKKGAVG